MKILQVIASRDTGFGGPSNGAVSLHLALRARGVDGKLLSAEYGFGGHRIARPSRSKSTDHNIALPASRPYSLMGSRQLRKRLMVETKDADLVHIHGQYLLPNVYAYLAANRYSVAYGVQAHGSMEPYQRGKSRLRKWLYNKLIGDRIVRGAKYVLFASGSEAQRASDIVRGGQALVQPLGASLAETPRRPDRLDATLPERSRVYLFLGRLASKKRPDLLTRAWATARELDEILVVAGPDEDFTAETLAALAEELGCAGSVLFLGPVDPAEATWLYAHAGTFVLPSENENFAITIAEGMLAGCHVITTDQVAAHEHLLRSRTGQVIPVGDFEALVDSLRRARRAATDHVSSLRSKDYAERELSWGNLAETLIEVVKSDR
jgi:glycosyltransferase involved in cell wall biosynthesis